MTKNLTLKELEKYINKRVWEAVYIKKEIDFLNFVHQIYFGEPLSEFYLNYTLDAFSEYKILNGSIIKAKFNSIKAGLNKMGLDYLVEIIMNEEEEKKKGIDGKFG